MLQALAFMLVIAAAALMPAPVRTADVPRPPERARVPPRQVLLVLDYTSVTAEAPPRC